MASEELPSKLNSLLNDGETVRWRGSSNKTAKLIEGVFGAIMFFGFLGVFATLFIGGFAGFVFGAAIGTGLILLGLGLVVGQYLTGNTTYIATERRVVKFSESIFESDMSYIQWEDVNTIDVEEGLISRLCNCGTIEVEGYKTDDVELKHISDAYEAMNTLESLRE